MAATNDKKVCPDCGRKMVQQFIGLKHCKCGTSWKKDIGYFNRTPDMVFALQRQTIGKKTKQVPVIRYKETERKDDSDMIINEAKMSGGRGILPHINRRLFESAQEEQSYRGY